ncbi:hypothetical protein [Thalassomonas sp. M1454]|uniref:hypothetical protein n=1 Tax=Thalassomonas sp. M1454 TaxID=2594477 RepID=UPI00163D558A|nr:hypothetical protein [Thalassomonas sp. M1454]
MTRSEQINEDNKDIALVKPSEQSTVENNSISKTSTASCDEYNAINNDSYELGYN